MYILKIYTSTLTLNSLFLLLISVFLWVTAVCGKMDLVSTLKAEFTVFTVRNMCLGRVVAQVLARDAVLTMAEFLRKI